jgi:membrane-associated phospholipid phosphatase
MNGGRAGRDIAGRPAAWLLVTSGAYVLLYGLANYWTAGRAAIGSGVYAWEAAIPFVGWTIVPYLSIGIFFALSFFIDPRPAALQRHVLRLTLLLVVSVGCYALFPLRFNYMRPATHGAIGLMFDALSAVDLPYNRAPSLHIGVLVLLWVRWAPTLAGWKRIALGAWFLLIAASVLTTYQHHVLDIPAGAAVAALVLALTARRAAERGAGASKARGVEVESFTRPTLFHR